MVSVAELRPKLNVPDAPASPPVGSVPLTTCSGVALASMVVVNENSPLASPAAAAGGAAAAGTAGRTPAGGAAAGGAPGGAAPSCTWEMVIWMAELAPPPKTIGSVVACLTATGEAQAPIASRARDEKVGFIMFHGNDGENVLTKEGISDN